MPLHDFACLAQDRPQEVSGLPGVDLVVGNFEKSRLLRKIVQAYPGQADRLSPGPLPPLSPWGGGISRFEGHRRAVLKVQDGCNFGCSFCLIPRVRGEMVSRPAREIEEEGRRLAQGGVKELVLAGIQLSSYGRDWGLGAGEPRLAPVVGSLLALPGIKRVRLSSYAVADFEDALLHLWKEVKGLCPHLHLPLQSGNGEVLKAMRRPYSLDRYRETVRKVRAVVPGIGLTSDLIAGFPGETDEAFQDTLDRVREFGFLDFHPFPYSDRPGTPGEAETPKVEPAVIRERMDALLSLKKDLLDRAVEEARGKVYRVIVEKHRPGLQAGLTDHGLRVAFPAREGLLGGEADVRVLAVQGGYAFGEMAD